MIFDAAEYVKLKKEKDMLKGVYLEQQKHEELMKGNMANAQFLYMDEAGLPTYNFM